MPGSSSFPKSSPPHASCGAEGACCAYGLNPPPGVSGSPMPLPTFMFMGIFMFMGMGFTFMFTFIPIWLPCVTFPVGFMPIPTPDWPGAVAPGTKLPVSLREQGAFIKLRSESNNH
ncbi:hypothetical protein KEM55_001526 [Ascosphaera atra]|nr:hypothetical protein KEM55_001526 [Ascosphaera atra]